eukprot:12412159-Karenia_brevis.AAC.1
MLLHGTIREGVPLKMMSFGWAIWTEDVINFSAHIYSLYQRCARPPWLGGHFWAGSVREKRLGGVSNECSEDNE